MTDDKHPISLTQDDRDTLCWREHTPGWVCVLPEGHPEPSGTTMVEDIAEVIHMATPHICQFPVIYCEIRDESFGIAHAVLASLPKSRVTLEDIDAALPLLSDTGLVTLKNMFDSQAASYHFRMSFLEDRFTQVAQERDSAESTLAAIREHCDSADAFGDEIDTDEIRAILGANK